MFLSETVDHKAALREVQKHENTVVCNQVKCKELPTEKDTNILVLLRSIMKIY